MGTGGGGGGGLTWQRHIKLVDQLLLLFLIVLCATPEVPEVLHNHIWAGLGTNLMSQVSVFHSLLWLADSAKWFIRTDVTFVGVVELNEWVWFSGCG